ncbi:MAG: hypothetical protein ACRECO_11330 [Xanthobacteraceae bacterium]
MWKLALILVTAAAITAAVVSANEAGAQVAVTCGGAIQKCPEGKKMYCNRWRPCKSKKAKVRRYCDAPVCITERKNPG